MTRQQRWSKGAYDKVHAHAGQGDESEYRTLCMKMPGLLKQAGLIQALVFMQCRAKDRGKAFVGDLQGVVGGADLIQRAQKAPLEEYLALSHEVSAVALWFRRFAQSELKPGDAQDGAA